MNLSMTSDQLALADLFGKIFRTESTPARIRAAEPLGWDGRLWDIVTSAGAPTMALAESLGGGAASKSDLAVVAVEHGRHLAAVPLAEVLAATHLLAGLPAGHDLIPEIARGALLPTVCLRPVDGTVAPLVPAGAVADLVIYFDRSQLVALRREGARPHQPSPATFGSVPVADLGLREGWSQRRILAQGAAAAAAFEEAVLLWQLLTAASLVGLQQRALKMGVDYVNTREAFGVKLGWFQSIQHRLADVSTAGEGAELLMYKAAWAWDTAHHERDGLTMMAFLFTAEAAYETCRASLQVHGGYGFTLEYDIQLYYRRAKAWPLLLGPTRETYRHLAQTRYKSAQATGPGTAVT
jgi:alkylation response protein AidB-like acyl-CoA dehydrogenase